MKLGDSKLIHVSIVCERIWNESIKQVEMNVSVYTKQFVRRGVWDKVQANMDFVDGIEEN